MNDKEVATMPMRVQAGKFTLSGDGLCLEFDSGDAVSQVYKNTQRSQRGTIYFVTLSTGKEQYTDLQREAARTLAKE